MASKHRGSGAARAAAAAAVVLAVTGVMGGCGTQTATTYTWSATPSVPGAIRHVLVFGSGMSETHRRAIEDGLAARLSREGVDARPSYALFPTLPDRDAARVAVRDAGIDGALVATVRGVRERQSYVPGRMTGGFYGGYANHPWGGMYTPGYVVTDEIVDVETTLWDVRGDGVHVWSSTTQTTNPKNVSDFVTSLSKEVVPNLLEANLLGTSRRR